MRRIASDKPSLPEPNGLSPAALDGVIRLCFIQPQGTLAQRDKVNKSKLENVAVLAVQLETEKPSSKSTMLADPVVIRLGLQEKGSVLAATDVDLTQALAELKKRDSQIGGWTLVYDVRPEAGEKRPTWRLATEVRPSNIVGLSWYTPGGAQRLLCLDVKGVGVFVGRQRKAGTRRHT
jgi:hypothetical protein